MLSFGFATLVGCANRRSGIGALALLGLRCSLLLPSRSCLDMLVRHENNISGIVVFAKSFFYMFLILMSEFGLFGSCFSFLWSSSTNVCQSSQGIHVCSFDLCCEWWHA